MGGGLEQQQRQAGRRGHAACAAVHAHMSSTGRATWRRPGGSPLGQTQRRRAAENWRHEAEDRSRWAEQAGRGAHVLGRLVRDHPVGALYRHRLPEGLCQGCRGRLLPAGHGEGGVRRRRG